MATTTAHTEQHGGSAKPAFPPFNPATFGSQLVWLVITFVALYVLMSKLALPRISGIIENRRQHIDGDLSAADELKAKSEAALTAYEKALAEARSSAQGMANAVREKQAAAAEANRKKLEASLNVKLEEAEKAIAATKTQAMSNVRGIAVDAAGAIVARLLGTAVPGKMVEDAVDSTLKR